MTTQPEGPKTYSHLVSRWHHLLDLTGILVRTSRYDYPNKNDSHYYVIKGNAYASYGSHFLLNADTHDGVRCNRDAYRDSKYVPIPDEETARLLEEAIEVLSKDLAGMRVAEIRAAEQKQIADAAKSYVLERLEEAYVPRVHVVVGILYRDSYNDPNNHVLLRRRPMTAGTEFPGYWEFPGGKVQERNEGEQFALAREFQEETGLDIDVDDMCHKYAQRFDPPETEKPLLLTYYAIRRDTYKAWPEPVAVEPGTEIAWVPMKEVMLRPVTPGTAWFVKHLT